jgi:hypothetical protein
VEGETQEPALAAAPDPRDDVEERSIDEGPGLDDPDPPGLLGDEDPTGPVARVGDVEWRAEAVDHDAGDGRHAGPGRRRAGRGSRRTGGDQDDGRPDEGGDEDAHPGDASRDRGIGLATGRALVPCARRNGCCLTA